MNNIKVGKTAMRLCEIALFAGVAVTCISCLFGRAVFDFFNTLSSVTACVCLVPIVAVFWKDIIKNKLAVGAIALFAVFSVVSSLFISGLYISHSLTAIIGIVTIYVMNFLPVKRDVQMALILFLSIMSVCLLFLAIDFSQKTLVEKYNYTNSNVMGIVALMVNSYLMTLINVNKISGKFVHLNIFIAIFAFMTITVFGCRSAQLGFLVFLIVGFLIPRNFWGKKRTVAVIALAMFVGIVFPFIYLKMSQNGLDDIHFPLVDKPWFSGRDVLWQEGVDRISARPSSLIFGAGQRFFDMAKDYNYHNSYFSILLNFGIPSFLFYYFSFFTSAKRTLLSGEDKNARALQLALILMIMVVSLVETTIPATTFIWLYGLCFIPLKCREIRS